ncbi:hypothetical protein DMN91_001343 [Ooceraea biroi]|uniref:T-box domain-containing protein n=3 Tax=Ooceraea biroi TaxID=2015173 RepID=A0A3L8E6A6_OOCBI|nr:hypothetical protein DMN91_001343 [Ooceraea biroi]
MLTPMELLQQHQRTLFIQQQIALHHRSDEGANSNRWPISSRPMLPPEVRVELNNRKLWQQFHAETTEMIITKSGRRMFPSVQANVSGLQKRERYYVLMEITPASNRRHKYCGNNGGDDNDTTKSTGGWTFAGPAEPQPHIDRRIYLHPDSPSTGEHWMQNMINFSKLKLTNNIVDHRTNVVLTSMHKYVPQIWIIRCDNAKNLNELFSHPSSSFIFRETEFIAVTAYQNENITKLKIDNNPFAKGFRETGQSRCKRKYPQMDSECINYTHTQAHDEEANLSFESDSSHSENSASSQRTDASIDNLTQKSKVSRLEIAASSDDDVCDAESPMMNDAAEKAPQAEGRYEDEVQPRFHRPWLSSKSSEVAALATPLTPPNPPVLPTMLPSSTSGMNWTSYYLNYVQAHQNFASFPQYHHLMMYLPRYS